MIHPGLVSVTFRHLSAKNVVDLAVQAGLTGIEWGGDKHVPHGDLKIAKQVREYSIKAGLEVTAYGSYYRVGSSEKKNLHFRTS